MIVMTKPKILPPSMRSSKRYLAFEIISDATITYNDFVNAVWNSMLTFLGEFTTPQAKVWVIQNLFDEKSQRGIIKCGTNYVEHTRVVLSLINMIEEKKVIIKILGVTGTIKSAKNKYLAGEVNEL